VKDSLITNSTLSVTDRASPEPTQSQQYQTPVTETMSINSGDRNRTEMLSKIDQLIGHAMSMAEEGEKQKHA
jgi:hypothetical protein